MTTAATLRAKAMAEKKKKLDEAEEKQPKPKKVWIVEISHI